MTALALLGGLGWGAARLLSAPDAGAPPGAVSTAARIGGDGAPPASGLQPAALPLPGTVPAPPPATVPVPVLTEEGIAAHRATVPTLLRLDTNGRIFVLDFPSLAAQGLALNRVAALVEKRDLPRDRVLSETEMEDAIRRAGGSAETYYYGHDYRAADLDRFFALAERDGLALSPAERWVRQALARARAAAETRDVAILSIATDPGLDEAGRRAILRHEIGHGHDFTLPFYNAHVRRVWHEWITEADRAAFREFLAAEGYDPGNEELMATEFQAYLLFTPDPRFFSPAMVRLPPARIEAIRAALRDGPGPP